MSMSFAHNAVRRVVLSVHALRRYGCSTPCEHERKKSALTPHVTRAWNHAAVCEHRQFILSTDYVSTSMPDRFASVGQSERRARYPRRDASRQAAVPTKGRNELYDNCRGCRACLCCWRTRNCWAGGQVSKTPLEILYWTPRCRRSASPCLTAGHPC